VPTEPITLNGFANPVGAPARSITYGRYGITRGVPVDIWETWLEQNKDSDLVRNGLIFALGDDIDALYEAKKRTALRSGLEPLEPGQQVRVTERGLEPVTGKARSGVVIEQAER
jgi:hypothetical protein